MIDMKSVSLLDIIPSNIKDDPSVAAAALAIDAELKGITDEIQKLSIFSRSDEWTEEETDELAWQFHVDFYNPSLPIEQKRELVKNSIAWHRRKGTPSAVEELVSTLFGSGKVEEWWEYNGQPYHFRVLTDNPAVNNERAQEFIRAIQSVKRLTAKLDEVVISDNEQLPMYFGGAVLVYDRITVR